MHTVDGFYLGQLHVHVLGFFLFLDSLLSLVDSHLSCSLSRHMVQNQPCWDASCTMRLLKQNNSYQFSLTCLCFGNLTV